jgi:predicted small integral membrane protein
MLEPENMSSQVIAWESVRPVPAPEKGLLEPVATDETAPRSWLRWPPGAAFLVIACSAMIFMAAFQTSMSVVRTEGLRGGIADVEENIQETLPVQIPLPAFVHPAKPAIVATSTDSAAAPAPRRHAHHRRTVKLHRLLQQNGGTTTATPWSHDAAN